ncbi:fungal-specific transcription factor domain-containing protein [Aspergillus bertholletiae]|uniref:Fungal-specific transcription factor domain-containing protein n=1 Tax=Aspergillus bertholletiae TaxID=1226010 RepID=A0A5N7B8M4_9EURO|nr:fungal-specific transcription factor domain-containing protein [Aspergillus bertholletiae]
MSRSSEQVGSGRHRHHEFLNKTLAQADIGAAKQEPPRHKVCNACRRKKQAGHLAATVRCSTCRERRSSSTRNEERRVMINRLETNIERMESRLHSMGLKLSESNATAAQEFPCSNAPALERSSHDTASDPDLGNFCAAQEPDPMSTTSGADANPGIVFSYKNIENWPPCLAYFSIPRSLVDTPLAGGFSAISQKGLEWISQKAGNVSLGNLSSLLSVKGLEGTTTNNPLEGAFPSRMFCSLPTKEEIVSLVQDYLEEFNVLFPIFQRSELLSLFSQKSLDMGVQTPSQWACINAILATAYMIRPGDEDSGTDHHQKSWLFMQNALEVVNGLGLGPPDLLAVQALLLVATFLLGTSAEHPCGFLVSAAIRICHELGLGKTDDGSPLCPEEIQHRQTVFWIAYWLDRELSLRFCEPPAQSDEDFSATLPMEAPTGSKYNMPTNDFSGSFNAFRSTCQLAIIKGQLYRDLYSPAAEDKPLSQIIASVGKLDEKLQEWKRSIPPEYQPEKAIPDCHRSKMSPVLLLLHYSYFHCMIAIHRRVVGRGLSIGMDLMEKNDVMSSPASLSNPRVLLSTSLCTKAARASIKLTSHLSENVPFFGSYVYYPVVASMTLSWSIIRNPQDANRGYNLKLIDRTEDFLTSQAFCNAFEGIRRLVKQCTEYRSIAEAAVKATMSACSAADLNRPDTITEPSSL